MPDLSLDIRKSSVVSKKADRKKIRGLPALTPKLPVPQLSRAQRRELRGIEASMEYADSYRDWSILAQAHDKVSGRETWREQSGSDLFDYEQVQRRYQLLRNCCDQNDIEGLLFALNEGIHGNMGGMGQAKLYRQSRFGTKRIIHDYVDVVIESLHRVYDADDSEVPFEDKLDFFRRARHCYGRSALSFSGGAGLVYFHHGVVNALLEEDLLPQVLAGSSAGAWMCAQIGTRTDDELREHFKTFRYSAYEGMNFKKALQMRDWEQAEDARLSMIDELSGDMTFQEAFEHTGRYINISISPAEKHQTSRLMNAITSPNVTIASAVRASSAVPGISEPVMLEAKDARGNLKPYLASRRWTDGSMAQDIPTKPLSRLFGVNHLLVSVINPLALPFVSDPKVRKENMRRSVNAVLSAIGRETVKTSRRVLEAIGRDEWVDSLDMVNTMISQDFTGDINMILTADEFHWRQVAFFYRGESEIQAMIKAGEKATWPRMEMIRNCSAISRELDDLMQRIDERDLRESHVPRRRHMTQL